MDLMLILLSTLHAIWVALSSVYWVVYFLQCNLVPVVINVLAFLMPLWLFARRKLVKSKISMAFANPESIISEIYKMIPAAVYNGWQLTKVLKGLRLWQRLNEKFSCDVAIISGSLCLDCKPKSALHAVLDMEELPHWFDTGYFTVTQLIPVRKLTSRSTETSYTTDTISYHRNRPIKAVWKVLHGILNHMELDSLATTYIKQEQQEIIIKRVWHIKENGQCFMLMLPEKPELAGYHWTCYLFSELEKSRMFSLTLASVAVLPFNNNHSCSEAEKLSFQLLSLRENIVFKKLGVYSRKRPRKSSSSFDITQKSVEQNKSDLSPVLNDKVLPTMLPDLPTPTDKDDSVNPMASSAPASANNRYDSLIQKSVELMMEVSRGSEEDGWTHMGVTKDVEVMKKSLSKGQSSCLAIKGKGLIHAPPEFVLQFLLNNEISRKVDELLKEVQYVERPKDFVDVARLMYKSVWPTTARDFVVVSYCKRVDATTRVCGGFSVTHPNAPEDSSYVRGELIAGGYVIKDCPNNPTTCEVTYISQSDIKGNIPTMIVNRAMASQPMCVSRLRNMVEPLYSSPHKNPSTAEAVNNIKVPPPFKAPEVNREIKEDRKLAHEEPPVDTFMEKTLPVQPIDSNHSMTLHSNTLPNGLLQHDTATMDTKSSPSVINSTPTSTNSRYDSLIQRSVELMMEISHGTEKDGWTHMGVTNDVEVMKKSLSKGQSSCLAIKGKGLIRAPPEFVLRFLLNNEISRKVDELLKEVQYVERPKDFVDVARLMYKSVWPTTARDFVVVSYCKRVDATTRVCGGFSVTHPNAPEDSSYVRGELIAGGYVIKDCPNNPTTCEVTYISQSDIKGNIPTMIVNRAMASQPMCVSRLRNMVEPLYSSPHKNPSTAEAVNNIKVPPPFKAPEVNREIKEDRKLVHEEPPVDTFMEKTLPVQPIDSNHSMTLHSNTLPNGLLQHDTATMDTKSSPSIVNSTPTSTNSRYDSLIQQSVELMMEISQGTEKDGWTHMGVTNDVEVMKKSLSKGQSSCLAIKGKGLIHAPPEFVLRFLLNNEISRKVDELLKEVQYVERPKDFVDVARLMYKSVWPTTARDFVVVSYCKRVDATTRVCGGFSVTHPNAPEDSSYVRGELIAGGYVIKDCPNNPATCEVTYISQSDIKGNIPTMIVNRAMASQPMCVSRLRNMVEPLYSSPHKNPSTAEAVNNIKVPPLFKAPEVNREIKEDRKLVHEELPVDTLMEKTLPVQPIDSNHSMTLNSNALPNGLPQHNTATMDTKSSPSNAPFPSSRSARTLTANVDSAPLSTTSTNCRYDSLIQQSVELMMEISRGTEEDGWTHMGVTKDVEVMKKSLSRGRLPCLAVKGKGLIHAPSECVLQFLLNDEISRKVDELLNEVQFIERMRDFVDVVRLMYKAVWPTTARDFVVVSYCKRIDATTRICGAFSVTHPNAPEDSSYVRGELIAGGYVIKDCPNNPATCEVTYISQSDIKGNIPTMVVNRAMASQPMCVSRLRNMVEPLFSCPQQNPLLIEALNSTKVPPYI